MKEVVIEVENLSKQYRLGVVGTGSLVHDLNRIWHKVRGKEDPYLKIGEENNRTINSRSEYVWSLKDIGFEVQKGEVLGILGKNGAGKSTLLKILSQVTSPTSGSVKIKGRVASLLEVGTGFHPELTGRENIFLNGAILGMSKKEIKSKFDEIVEFSGVQRYIDTPVKRYSSGMYVRLAFAVAAHLEPEILIVDEVLAVGDAEFQKKCLGKMKEVSGEGRTVLFVSHNMAALKSLCTRGILLQNGRMIFSGNTDECINIYLNEGSISNNSNYKRFDDFTDSNASEFKLISAEIRTEGKDFSCPIRMNDNIECIIKYYKKQSDCRVDTSLTIKDASGNILMSLSSAKTPDEFFGKTGIIQQRLIIPSDFFNSQTFYVNLIMVKDRTTVIAKFSDVLSFNVLPKEQDFGAWKGNSVAPLLPSFKWESSMIA